jgi:hypothetical protein
MPKMYSLFNRRKNIFQPNLIRNRQAYNGPISSESLNLFNDQFIVDVARLSEKSIEIENKIQEIVQLRSESLESATPGLYLNEEIDFTIYTQKVKYDRNAEEYVVTSETPYFESDLSFYKPVFLSSMISLLEDKLNKLEKTINIE